MKIKKYLFIFLIYFLNINISYAIQPDIFVQSTVNRASSILSEEISKEEKISKLKIIAKETVDINGIGLYTLGSFRKILENQDSRKIVGFDDFGIFTVNGEPNMGLGRFKENFGASGIFRDTIELKFNK